MKRLKGLKVGTFWGKPSHQKGNNSLPSRQGSKGPLILPVIWWQDPRAMHPSVLRCKTCLAVVKLVKRMYFFTAAIALLARLTLFFCSSVKKNRSTINDQRGGPQETPIGRTSCSTNRRSMDLPPFRPSLDFVHPPVPNHGPSSSVDDKMTSFDFGSSPPSMLHSTPYQKPVVTQSTPGLPTFTPKMGLLHEVKDALRQYGRSIDTPAPASQPKIAARGPLSTNVSLLSIRGRQPLQGILKNRPSLDSLAAGIDLPPIPNKVRKAASKDLRASLQSNEGRSHVLAHP